MFTLPNTETVQKMGCIGLCGGVHTAQMTTQIPIGFCLLGLGIGLWQGEWNIRLKLLPRLQSGESIICRYSPICGCVLKVFRVSEERRFEVEKKAEPTQSQAADRFEQRIRQHRQQHKEEMEVRPFFSKSFVEISETILSNL